MDRPISYVGAIALIDDFLRTNKYAMTAIATAMKAIIGTTTLFDGLACTPTGPASMQVIVGPGSVYSLVNLDATAYGDLGSDTTHQIVKQGLSLDNVTLSLTAPGTTGFSTNYLIQAVYEDSDTDSTVLPYFNASNPAVAWNGPANAGTSQNTTRKGICNISLKAGTAATTGTQTTPAPDAGQTGLWYVTVANGATSITSGNIHLYSGSAAATGSASNWSAPFITEKLMDKVSIATGDLRWAPLAGGGGTSRTLLTNNTNFYVATTGSDSNPGTSGSPWLTLQHAYNVIAGTIDLAGFTATINVADGSYPAGLKATIPLIGGQLQITGNTTTPTNCNVASAVADAIGVFGEGCQISIAGFSLSTSGSGGNGLNASNGGRIVVNGNMNYAAMTSGSAQIFAGFGGEIDVTANYSISAGGFTHASSQNNGIINLTGGITATLSGSPAFSHAYFWTQVGSLVWAVGYSVSGAGSGPAYLIQANSVLQMNGGGFTFSGASGGTADGSTFGLIF